MKKNWKWTKRFLFLLSGLAVILLGAWYVFSSFFSLNTKLDNYVNAYVKQGKFSGSVLIAKNGKILLYKGYGMANYAYNIPNTPQTKFRLGSITKQFTAMAIMQLQEKGLLNVNDTVSKYISDYPNGDKITIHELLTHTSGIPNLTDFPEYKNIKKIPYTLEQLIAIFKDKPLDFKPGETFKYSNSGYILLSYIIEKSSGKTYETVLQENIFTPLGMNNTGYDHASIIIKNRASGYSMNGDSIINADYIDMSFPSGAGGLYSTVKDMYLWDQALYTKKLLPKKSLAIIFTPSVKLNKNDPESFYYGYGWCMGKIHNHNFVGHDGGIDGFSTSIGRYPDDKICIIILSNNDNYCVSKIATGLDAIIFGEKYELPKKHVIAILNPEILDRYIGKYKIKEDYILTLTKEDNKLILQATGQRKVEIYPETETKFFNESIDAEISFVKDEKGKVIKLILRQDQIEQVAEKIE